MAHLTNQDKVEILNNLKEALRERNTMGYPFTCNIVMIMYKDNSKEYRWYTNLVRNLKSTHPEIVRKLGRYSRERFKVSAFAPFPLEDIEGRNIMLDELIKEFENF